MYFEGLVVHEYGRALTSFLSASADSSVAAPLMSAYMLSYRAFLARLFWILFSVSLLLVEGSTERDRE